MRCTAQYRFKLECNLEYDVISLYLDSLESLYCIKLSNIATEWSIKVGGDLST